MQFIELLAERQQVGVRVGSRLAAGLELPDQGRGLIAQSAQFLGVANVFEVRPLFVPRTRSVPMRLTYAVVCSSTANSGWAVLTVKLIFLCTMRAERNAHLGRILPHLLLETILNQDRP